MQVITVANRKGGVGKTATVATLGSLLSIYGKRVLVIDSNPGQANLSRYFNKRRDIDTIADIYINGNMNEEEIRKLIKRTEYANLDIIPANETLFTDESKIPINKKYTDVYILRNALRKIEDDYDYALIDCGPNNNDFVINALCASDGVLIPVQDEAQSHDGFLNMFFTVREVAKKLNPSIKILGVFFTMPNPRTETFKEYYNLYKEQLGNILLNVFIRRENIMKEAVSSGKPLPFYYNFSNALLDYERLLRELNLLSGKDAAKLNEKINRGEKLEEAKRKREEKSRKKRKLFGSNESDE